MFIAMSLTSIGPVLAFGAVGSARSCPLLLVFGFFLGVAGTIFADGIWFANNSYEPARSGFTTGVFGSASSALRSRLLHAPVRTVVRPLRPPTSLSGRAGAHGGAVIVVASTPPRS